MSNWLEKKTGYRERPVLNTVVTITNGAAWPLLVSSSGHCLLCTYCPQWICRAAFVYILLRTRHPTHRKGTLAGRQRWLRLQLSLEKWKVWRSSSQTGAKTHCFFFFFLLLLCPLSSGLGLCRLPPPKQHCWTQSCIKKTTASPYRRPSSAAAAVTCWPCWAAHLLTHIITRTGQQTNSNQIEREKNTASTEKSNSPQKSYRAGRACLKIGNSTSKMTVHGQVVLVPGLLIAMGIPNINNK